jgi:hydrogenase nickel incorporation protein HypA/HybF
MHEVSIAMGMIDEVMRIARENNARSVVAVNVKIGKRSGVVTDSLKFAFDSIKYEHPILSRAEIVIKEIPIAYECRDCHTAFHTEDIYYPSCPHCLAHNVRLLTGEEMDIEDLEIEV